MNLAQHYDAMSRIAFGQDVLDDAAVSDSPAPETLVHESAIARGDSLLDVDEEGRDETVDSPLEGVDDVVWTQYVRLMIVAPVSAVSASNALGMFGMMPRRLADLGMIKKLKRQQSNANKTIWAGEFISPLTANKFLKNPQLQYIAFARSMKDYDRKMESLGEIARDPSMSRSGALSILHRAGPSGLKTWASGNRFPSTVDAYERVAGVF